MSSKFAVTTLLGILLLPAAAHAGTVSRSGSTLVYNAGAGEINDLIVAFHGAGRGYSFGDQAPVSADPASGCTQSGAQVSCPDAGVSALSIQLADGNDRFSAGRIQLPMTIDGGDGDDDLRGGFLGDVIQGGNGNDTLNGAEGADRYVGGPGDDVINAIGGGIDTLDCAGGGNDKVQRDTGDQLAGCPTPGASLTAPAPRLKKFLKRGLRFSVSCPQPCAIGWQLQGGDNRTRLHVRNPSGILSKQLMKLDRDAFPILGPAGSQTFLAGAGGRATKKSFARMKKLKVLLVIEVENAASAQQEIRRTLTIRR